MKIRSQRYDIIDLSLDMGPDKLNIKCVSV